MRGQPGSDLYALREENASLRQVCPLCSTGRAVLGGRHFTTAQKRSPAKSCAHYSDMQVVRERLNTLSKEARRAVLQQHAELCALAVGVEGIPSLDSETFPEVGNPPKAGVIQRAGVKLQDRCDVQEVLETALVDGIELPRSSTLEPAHASTAAAATPVRPGHMAEQAPPAEARVPAVNGGDWEHIANGEAKVTLGED